MYYDIELYEVNLYMSCLLTELKIKLIYLKKKKTLQRRRLVYTDVSEVTVLFYNKYCFA